MEAQNELISLFDYLGRAAGGDLGKKVATVATRLGEPVGKRKVATKTYTGDVLLYRRQFLQEYFTNETQGVNLNN